MLYGEHAKCQAEAEYPELWDGLVGAWSPCLSPRGGTVLRDLSGRGNHGTLTNMDAATDWVVRGGRQALDFDGSTSDRVVTNSRAVPASTFFSLHVWFTYRSTATPQGIFCQWQSGAAGRVFFVINYNRTTGTVLANEIALGLSTGIDAAGGNIGAKAGSLVYACASVRNSLITVMVDGIVIQEELTSFSGPPMNAVASIGSLDAAGSLLLLDGLVFDACVTDRPTSYGEHVLRHRLGPGGWATPRRRRWNYVTAQTAIPYWVFGRKNARLIGGGVS